MGDADKEEQGKGVVRDVLDFWFGTGVDENREIWFKSTPVFDQEIKSRFGIELVIAVTGGHDDLAETAEGALALVILLDQFPRNLLRKKAEAFENDDRALQIAKAAIARGFDLELPPIRRRFLYLPFEHSENLQEQKRGVELFMALGDEDALKYMVEHHDVIARFGRFPHRNEVLGRKSTPEELEFLETFDSF